MIKITREAHKFLTRKGFGILICALGNVLLYKYIYIYYLLVTMQSMESDLSYISSEDGKNLEKGSLNSSLDNQYMEKLKLYFDEIINKFGADVVQKLDILGADVAKIKNVVNLDQ